MMPTITDLTNQLKELINNSPALQSLTPEDRKMRTDIMLSANEDTMKEFIKVLEDEQKQMKKIDEDFEKEAGNLQDLVTEATTLEKTVNRELQHEKEAIIKKAEEEKAEDLLKKLEEISGSGK